MDLKEILGGLNAAQAAAVTADAEVVQILAPPGSGKTKTLTSRVAYLLSHHGYQPWDVLCLTFTIKSAREMKDRIAKLVGNGLETKIVLGTFHSVCRRYLVTYGHLIGLKKGFGIADSTDSMNVIKRIVKRLKISLEPATIRSRISSSKARRVGYEELRAEASRKKSRVEQQEFLQVFEEYESHLSISNLLDYDDLLLRCVDLLQQHPECVSNVEAVLIDEFQDTNSVQFDLMRLFAARNHRITTVGDPDQSIYGWRSAEVKNLKKMQVLYPDTLVLNLESNYRSSGAILSAALDLIEQDESRPSKALLPTHCYGTFPVLRKLPSSYAEAAWIVSEIRRYIALSGGSLLNFSDFAILLRSAALSRQIESALGKSGIPYRMVGGARFFDRVEVKILLNYLRVIGSPNNSEAFSAIINVPPRRIGEGTIKSLLEEARINGSTLFDLCRGIAQGNATNTVKLTKQAEQGLSSLINIILTARKKLSEEASFYPTEVLAFVLKRLEFKAYLSRSYPEDEDSRWANVEELVGQAADPAFGLCSEEEDPDALPTVEGAEKQLATKPTEEALTKFLANVALSTELQTDDDQSDGTEAPRHRITISTIHAAKGLEWPVVFIPSAYHGSIPHSRAEDNDEERRLLYVAMTRAQCLLSISYPLRNSTSGEETNESHFLASKKIRRRFAGQGPSLPSHTIHQIAQILRRDSPTEDAINAGLSAVENIEDDMWTIEGEECRAAVSKWSRESAHERPFKRQRVEHANSTFSARNEPMHTNATMDFIQSGGPHTSLHNSSGFISANLHLSTIKQPAIQRPGSKSPKKQSSAAVKMRQGQGTLTSLWSKPAPIVDGSTPSRLNGPSHISSLPPVATNQGVGKRSFGSVVNNAVPLSYSAQSSRSEEGSLLPKYSISRAAYNRPRSTTTADSENAPYVFLSSSPPQPAKQKAESHEQNPPSEINRATVSATTFHVTSMDKLHGLGGVGVKKSLGVRRTMAGWNSQGPRPFTVPRRI